MLLTILFKLLTKVPLLKNLQLVFKLSLLILLSAKLKLFFPGLLKLLLMQRCIHGEIFGMTSAMCGIICYLALVEIGLRYLNIEAQPWVYQLSFEEN